MAAEKMHTGFRSRDNLGCEMLANAQIRQLWQYARCALTLFIISLELHNWKAFALNFNVEPMRRRADGVRMHMRSAMCTRGASDARWTDRWPYPGKSPL